MSNLRVSRRPRLLIALVAIIAILAACSAASAPLNQVGNAVPDAGAAAAPAGQQFSGDQSNPGTGSQPGPNTGQQVPQYDINRPDLLIIKTGQLSLQVDGIDAALAAASGKIAALGGYVAGSDRKGDGDQMVATETYRIPAAEWDAALVALRGLATKVTGETTQTQDVTGDVLDLGARIANLQATETALQGIMLKATKIADVLAVQQQLTDVRGQIEQLSTQKKHLEGQAAFSTLTVAYGLKPAPAVVTSQENFDPNSEIDKASASLVDVLQALVTAGIWFVIVWLPILIGLAILGGIIALVVRRFLPRRPEAGPGSILPAPTEGQP
jgi:hypothetical protein